MISPRERQKVGIYQIRILSLLRKQPHLTVTKIAKSLQHDYHHVTQRSIDRLIDGNLVEYSPRREGDPLPLRPRYRLTRKGHSFLTELKELLQ